MKHISVRWKIFSVFLLFAIVLIAVLWFFQIVYLNDFYKLIKKNETEDVIEEIEDLLYQGGDCSEDIDAIAASNNLAIYITDSEGNGIYNAEYISNSQMSSLPGYMFDLFYSEAVENGGEAEIEYKGSQMQEKEDSGGPGASKEDDPANASNKDDASDETGSDTTTSEDTSDASGTTDESNSSNGSSDSSEKSTDDIADAQEDTSESADSSDSTSSSSSSKKKPEHQLSGLQNPSDTEGAVQYTISPNDKPEEIFMQNIGNDVAESIIYVKIVDVDDVEYVLMVNSVLTPVDSTVTTLKSQLLIISLIMIIVGFVIAIILSASISKSMIRLNEGAQRLAEGDYSVHFDSEDYKEVAQLSATLNYAAGELEKTDSLQKELIANVSHDLRTPLTMIKGYSEVMRDIPGENTPENVQVIIDETERLTGLVNDMLDISKLKAGTIALKPETYNITDSIKTVLMRYNKLREVEGYTIDFDYDREVEIYADEQKMYQVIYNLINNAINYTGDDKKVFVTQKVIDDEILRFEVKDTGKGVKPEDIPYVWDRYYKDKSAHKRAIQGTGLGLSIVKSVLELHGAKYGVSSAVGKGATFWFEMPLDLGEEA